MFGSADPPRPQDVLAEHRRRYDAAIASGVYRPFVWPLDSLGITLICLYTLIPWRNSRFLSSFRVVVWLINLLLAVNCILYARSANPATSLGVGLMSSFAVAWSAALLLIHNPQKEFKRIQFANDDGYDSTGSSEPDVANGKASSFDPGMEANGLTARTREHEKPASSKKAPAAAIQTRRFRWEAYPMDGSFRERLLWVGDLACNFRGIGWNWCDPTSPPPPSSIQLQLDPPPTPEPEKDTRVGRSGQVHQRTRRELVRTKLTTLVFCYLLVDCVKTAAMHDAYFYAPQPHPPPAWLPSMVRQSPVLLQSVRLLIGMGGIYGALTGLFTLSPLIYSVLIGPRILRAQAEPWMYPSTWGSFDKVLDYGLAGWWGSWWHQTFRFPFDQPAQWALQSLGWPTRSVKAKLLRSVFAFACSGILHASGSFTQNGPSDPIRGHLRFFMLQPIGVGIEMAARTAARKTGLARKTPRWMARAWNLCAAHIWLYYTAPICVEDFGLGGVFLFEPIPLSPLRGLGFGHPGSDWWCWQGYWFQWHTGRRWWESGLVL